MIKTLKYRLYPNKKASKMLSKVLNTCRITYNNILSKKIEAHKTENKSLSKFEVNKILTLEKKSNEHLQDVHSQVLQNVSNRAHVSFANFFRRVKQKKEKPGFPRYKGKDRYDSFTFPQNNGSFKILDKWLHLSKIGKVRINLHRPLQGEVKTCTVRKTKTGKWYACFSTIVDKHELDSLDNTVGIDLGLEKFAYFSDDTIIKNPRILKKSEKKLKDLHSKFSKQKKGTSRRRKLGKSLCFLYEKIQNQRADFCHKISRFIVNNYQSICIEDLNIKSMLLSQPSCPLEKKIKRSMNRNINDVCWNQFSNFLSYKAEEAGRDLILVNPRNTSKMCSECGRLVPKELKDRIHKCTNCGLEMDRDKNASLNILRLGMESLRKQTNTA